MITPHRIDINHPTVNDIDWGRVVDLDGRPTGDETPLASTPYGLDDREIEDVMWGRNRSCEVVPEDGWTALTDCVDNGRELTDKELAMGRAANASRVVMVPVEDENAGEVGWAVLAQLAA